MCGEGEGGRTNDPNAEPPPTHITSDIFQLRKKRSRSRICVSDSSRRSSSASITPRISETGPTPCRVVSSWRRRRAAGSCRRAFGGAAGGWSASVANDRTVYANARTRNNACARTPTHTHNCANAMRAARAMPSGVVDRDASTIAAALTRASSCRCPACDHRHATGSERCAHAPSRLLVSRRRARVAWLANERTNHKGRSSASPSRNR